MIKRIAAVLLLTLTMLIGSSAIANAGELCIRLINPTRTESSMRFCLPTN